MSVFIKEPSRKTGVDDLLAESRVTGGCNTKVRWHSMETIRN